MRPGSAFAGGWILALLAAGAFAWLGQWQLGRAHAKQALLDAVQGTIAARAAGPLAAAGDGARVRDFEWAAGEGVFIEAPPVLLDNQQRGGRAGVRAYRAFAPGAGGTPLLVDLGWLPLPGDRTLPAVPRPRGPLRVEGLLAPPPATGLGGAAHAVQDDGTVLATGLDPAALAAALRQPALAPRVLRLDPALPVGYERDLDVLPNTLPPERHLGYAFQWFALAVAVIATALVLTLRRSRR